MLTFTRRLLRARRLLAIGGVCAVAVFGSGTIHAAAFSGGATTSCGPFGAMICTGASQAVQVGSSFSETVAYDCTAETTQTEISTNGETGVGCYLLGLNDGVQYGLGSSFTLGVVSTLNGERSVPVQPYELCVGGGWFVNGNFQPIQNYACFFAV
jgi:hypothetical protein